MSTPVYLTDRVFFALGAVAVLSALGFYWTPLFYLAVLLLVVLTGAVAYDGWQLYGLARGVTADRKLPKVLSLGDEQRVAVTVTNDGPTPVRVRLTDELPVQLQERDHRIDLTLPAAGRQLVRYPVRPLSRGAYAFGDLNLFLTTGLALVEWRVVVPAAETVPAYPSILQMQEFALRGSVTVPAAGRKRLRRLTKSYEFDQIKEYVTGDDYRSVNWKATGRRNTLMVNQYEDERAQRVYCCIDKGRTMLMPFGGLSLLDYAINATLALTNVILKRRDRAGLLTFAARIGSVVAADAKPDQLRRVMETLYRQQEQQQEADYDLLYYASRRLAGGRSTLILFTNFESNYALDRVLPALRRVARAHTLLVVLFENTEIADLLTEPATDADDVYLQSTARRYLQQRQLMAARLRQQGIRVLLTQPADLTGAVIEEYLTLKRSGLV